MSKNSDNHIPVRQSLRGFTLIELVVVVAIIGILAAIAYPAYTNHVQKSRRASAKSELMDLAARQEKYYAMNNRYTSTLSQLGYTSTGSQFDVDEGSNSAYYRVNVSVTAAAGNTAAGFVAVATPVGPQAGDSCGNLSLDSTGRQNASGGVIACW